MKVDTIDSSFIISLTTNPNVARAQLACLLKVPYIITLPYAIVVGIHLLLLFTAYIKRGESPLSFTLFYNEQTKTRDHT